ncbi:MAG: response regulator transcription factor [Lewinellaceae bacterium]|nr:response regulator transcription factor [Lewinellaceae bacterium]
MTCLALDDEPLALQLLETYSSRLPQLSPQGFFKNPDEAKSRLEIGDIDLVFLDIQMPDINGLHFLKQLEISPMVIFTTAFAEFAVEGFNLDAVDYLLKPFDFYRFEKAVNKAFDYRQFLNTRDLENSNMPDLPQPKSIFVRVGYSMTQIRFEDIRYIEGFDDYIKIHTDGKPVLTLLSLKNILEILPPEQFIRVHRSFIVALDKIESIRAQKITILGREIPVGHTFRTPLKEWFTRDRLD